ncbi:MAG: EamA family transporter [Gammaproteobacteria bacterium]
MTWVAYALLGALAAGATAILSKVGVGVGSMPSNLAVLIRTAVVLVITATIVVARGEHSAIREVKGGTWAALIVSGIATGISWLAYFKALQLAPASSVAPLDKLSLPVTIVLAALFLGEALTLRVVLGVSLMVVGAIVATRS